jgi:outer membrane protein OmpA-like peptidoglycan-associated protein
LKSNPKITIEIGGHTNNIPTNNYCDKLSTNRAKAVRDYILSKGISEDRVTFKGYGKRMPISSNATKDGRALNQRVEIKIISV